jgi:FlaA1/EpsC-like NDP-sugar epimerase
MLKNGPIVQNNTNNNNSNNYFGPQNVLITGGCGFIGSNFINYIFDKWPNSRFVTKLKAFFIQKIIFLILFFKVYQH